MKKIFTRKALSLVLTVFLFVTMMAGAALVLDVSAVENEATWGSSETDYSKNGTLVAAIEDANRYTTGKTYIKLLKDVNTTAPIEIYSGKTVELDLNGFKIDRGLSSAWIYGNGNVITVTGNLIIKDSAGNGKITGGYNNSYGGGIYVSGTLTLKGGEILNNKSLTNGGGIYSTQDGKVTIEGGKVTLNASSGKGGGIYSEGLVEIKGGEISFNTAATAPGGVYYTKGLDLSGNPKIVGNVTGGSLNGLVLTGGTKSNIYVISKSITIASSGGLTAGAEIWVSSANVPVPITSIGSADYSAYFHSDNPRYIIQSSGSGSNYQVMIGLQEAIWGYDTSYSGGGGTLTEVVSNISNLPANSTAYIFLQKDVTLTSAVDFPNGKTVQLDLNGKTIRRSLSTAESNGYVLGVSGILIINDTATGGKITGGNNSGNGGGILVYSGSLTVNGGSITGNRAINGGGIYVSDAASLVLNSASITNNTATSNGGGLYVGVATATISLTPVISGNSAASGGGIYLISSGTIDFSGTVTNNNATAFGGGVYAGGNFRASYSAYVYGNVKSYAANNIFLPNGNRVVINQTTGLSGNARMGITTEYPPTQTSTIQIITDVSANMSGYFTSDISSYGIKNNGTGSAQSLVLTVQSVAVGELSGTLTRNTATTTALTIQVTTTNISNGTAAVITWYNNASKTQYGDTYRPYGVTMTATAVNNNSVTLSVSSSSYAKAGDYYFTVTVDGIESDIKILKVGRSKLNIPTVTTAYYYTGYEQTATLTGFDYNTMAVVSGNRQTSVGTDYRIIIKLVDTTQYEWINGSTDNVSVYWTIYRATLTKPTVTGPCTYRGAEQEALLTNFNSSLMDIQSNKATNVGSYTLVISIKDYANYEWADHTTGNVILSWKIDKAPLTIKANDINIVYGDAAPVYSVAYNGLVGSDTYTVLEGTLSISCTYIRYANAGTYQIVPSGLSSSSYTITFAPGTLNVAKKQVAIAWSNTQFTYDGKSHKPDAELQNYTGAGRITVGGAMVNAGSYTAQAIGFSDINYELSNPSTTFNIATVPLTIKANDCTITYGAAPSGNGVTYSGFISGEGAGVLSGTLTYTFDYKQYDAVGSAYKVTPGGVTSVNYSITFVPATLTVNKAKVTIAITSVSSIVGTEPLTYKITEGAFVNGDEKYVKLSRAEGDTPGKYSIVGVLESVNYDFTVTPATYTILQTAIESSGNNYGISMSSEKGLSPDYKLTIKVVEKSNVSKNVPDGKVLAAYDISLTNNLVEVQPDGRVTVKIPDVGFEKYENIAIVHINKTGNPEYLNTVRENGYLTFSVDSLSTFAVVDLDANYTWVWVAAIAVVVVLGSGFFIYLFGFKKKSE